MNFVCFHFCTYTHSCGHAWFFHVGDMLLNDIQWFQLSHDRSQFTKGNMVYSCLLSLLYSYNSVTLWYHSLNVFSESTWHMLTHAYD